MRAPQDGQRDGGRTTDCSSGMRWMQTLAKLPTRSPKRSAATSTKGDDDHISAMAEMGGTSVDLPALPGGSQMGPPAREVVSSRGMEEGDGRPAAPQAGRDPWGRWALILLTLGVAVAFLASMLASTDGHFVPQVVDLYVVCQYARAMAEGHPFRYNPGEP